MKLKFLFSLLLAGSLTASAQGYKDGVEYFKADQPLLPLTRHSLIII